MDEPVYLTAEERFFLLQALATVQLSGDAAALRRALAILDAIQSKLVAVEESGSVERHGLDGGRTTGHG